VFIQIKGYSDTPGLLTVPWHLRQFGVVLPGLASETSKVAYKRERGGLAVVQTVQACVGEYEMLVWEVREGEAAAYGHFRRNRVSRCCVLGITQFTDRKAS